MRAEELSEEGEGDALAVGAGAEQHDGFLLSGVWEGVESGELVEEFAGVVGEDLADEAVYVGALDARLPGGVYLDGRQEVGGVGFQLSRGYVQDAVEDVEAVEGRGVPEFGGVVGGPPDGHVGFGGCPLFEQAGGEALSESALARGVATEFGVVHEE